MGWFFSHLAGGIIRWAIATVITAVCLMLSFSPETWIKEFIATPPAWLVHELTRLGFVIVGVAVIVGVFFWDRGIRRRRHQPTVTADVKTQSEFINLGDAVIDAWERIRNLPQFDEPPPNLPQFDSYREYYEANPTKMPGIIAQVIFNAADPPIPIEGISPPRTVMEVIPADKAAGYGFSDDAAELFDWFDEDKPPEQRRRYINLRVKRIDIERRIKDMGG